MVVHHEQLNNNISKFSGRVPNARINAPKGDHSLLTDPLSPLLQLQLFLFTFPLCTQLVRRQLDETSEEENKD